MTIIVASDHAGFQLKTRLIPWLQSKGHAVHDVGSFRSVSNDDYPAYAARGAKKVRSTSRAAGIFFCGSGVGMSIVANRFRGIRAVNAESREVARRSRSEDDANVLVLGSRIVTVQKARHIISLWLSTSFSKAVRHYRRVKMMDHFAHS